MSSKTSMVHLALDLGGTRIKLGLLHAGQLLISQSLPANSHQGLRPNLERIESAVDQMIQKIVFDSFADSVSVSGVSMAIPGVVDSEQEEVKSINDKYVDVREMNLPAWVQRAWDAPLILENDARMAGFGEWQLGAGQKVRNMVMVTLGTGIGTCAIVDGHMLRGSHHVAGNLGGHLPLERHGPPCNCLANGCGERLASTWSLPEWVPTLPGFSTSALAQIKSLDYKAIFNAANQGDGLAQDVVSQSLDIWSHVLFQLISAYDPEIIVLGGGISQAAENLAEQLHQRLPKTLWIDPQKVRIVPAYHPSSAALFGGHWLLSQGR